MSHGYAFDAIQSTTKRKGWRATVAEIERYRVVKPGNGTGAIPMWSAPKGPWVRHDDHLAQLVAKDEEIERLKGGRDAHSDRRIELETELAQVEQALPAELEAMAEEAEERANRIDRRGTELTDNELGRLGAHRKIASRLRERAAEIRRGND